MDITNPKEIKLTHDETANEANNLLSNGILVETSKGLICMSLNDALSSDLNLSVEDLQNVAAQLILQQNVDCTVLQPAFNFDSDGFSSECSDISTTTASSSQSTFLTFSPISNEIQANTLCDSQLQNLIARPKIVSIGSYKNVNDESCGNLPTNNTVTTPSNDKPKEIPKSDGITEIVEKPKKGRGGWPKGRKRKPELLNLPPKAPATGYNLYLNEQRKLFKDSPLAFHEITKIIGNKWSSLSLLEKKPYLAKAEEDKKRYREELKQYRQSDAYRAYLAKKRMKRLQNNVLSESDMDATDEIDEEDNEELYCRTCDQWFHNLHNKREHLQGKQHLQSVAGDIHRELGSDMDVIGTTSTVSFSTSLDESSLDAIPHLSNKSQTGASILETMTNLVSLVAKRENEFKFLERNKDELMGRQRKFALELCELNEKYDKLQKNLAQLKELEKEMESRVFRLWQLPSWLVINDLKTGETETE